MVPQSEKKVTSSRREIHGITLARQNDSTALQGPIYHIECLTLFRYTFAMKNLKIIAVRAILLERHTWLEIGGWTVLIATCSLFGLLATGSGTIVVWVLGLLGIILRKRGLWQANLDKESTGDPHIDAKNALAYRKDYLESLVESSPIAIVTLDMQQRIQTCNKAFETIFGYSSDEAVGNNLDDLIVPKEKKVEGQELTSTSFRRENIHRELVRKRKDGSLIDVELHAKSIYMDEEQVGVLAQYVDISERKRVEEKLHMFEHTIRSTTECISITDINDRIVFVNDAFLKTYGYTDAELLGKDMSLFRSPDNNPEMLKAIRPATQAGGWHGELVNRRKDGTDFPIYLSASAVRDERGGLVAMVGIATDITERKQAENKLRSSEAQFRSLWEGSSDGMRLTDQHGIILNVNLSFCAMMGVAREEIIGKPMSELYDPSIRNNVMKKLVQRLSADYIETHMGRDLLLRNGRTISVEVSNSVIARENGESAVLSIFRDVTERKKAEKKIEEQISVIENQNIELAKARDQATEANKTKSAFLANMSHELRTPLNAIIGYSEMLIEEMGDVGKTGYEGDLEKIQTAGKNLLGLINEVLDLSKIESGKMELYLEEFNLKTLVQEVVSTVQPLLGKNENVLVLKMSDELPIVRLDLTKIRQILFNLISNASKFTDHGTITLTTGVLLGVDPSSTKIIVKVSDTGIGLTEGQKTKLFMEFSQADSATTRKYGGTGLGLAITKRFCEMMNGSIGVESSPNKGTTFTLVIPHWIEDPVGKRSGKIDAERIVKRITANTAVLVIDDDPSVRDLLQRYLAKEGYVVECVSSGEEGLKRAKELIPMAIILDVMMPHKDGWAVLQEIKSDPVLKSVPVVMYTMVDEKNFGLAIGATEYLIKPVSREKILQVLEKVKRETPRKYVLLVDDDADFRDIASRAIEKEGWSVQTAENGISALALLEHELPSIIFLDLMMPLMDGFEFLTIMQSRKEWEHLPVVIVTSKDLSVDERSHLEGAVKKVIQKGDLTAEKLLKQLALLIPNLTHNTTG